MTVSPDELALGFDHDDAVRLRVPAADGAEWAELLAEASIEAIGARSGLAGRLAMILAQAADAALEDAEGDEQGPLELGVGVDVGLDQLLVSANRVVSMRRARERIPATDRLELLADEVELRPGPAGTSVRAKLSLGPPWAEPSQGEPTVGIAFEGPLFVRAVLPRALTAVARRNDASLGWASELMLLGDEIATRMIDAPRLETLRFDAYGGDGELTLRTWPLADEVIPTLTSLLGRDDFDADVELAGSEALARQQRLSAALPIPRRGEKLEA